MGRSCLIDVGMMLPGRFSRPTRHPQRAQQQHQWTPSELFHGVDIASDVIRMTANGTDERIQFFLEHLRDRLMELIVSFYVPPRITACCHAPSVMA